MRRSDPDPATSPLGDIFIPHRRDPAPADLSDGSARVVNKAGLGANRQNRLIMHAMGSNVSGVIGSAVAADVLLALL